MEYNFDKPNNEITSELEIKDNLYQGINSGKTLHFAGFQFQLLQN